MLDNGQDMYIMLNHDDGSHKFPVLHIFRKTEGSLKIWSNKAELEKMAECLNWTMENPARNFHEALQCLYMYQTCLCLDANMHGITFGRVDQYLGDYLDRDLENGTITVLSNE